MTPLRRGLLVIFLCALVVAPSAAAASTEVVVTLGAPSLATAVAKSRVLSARTKTHRLDLRSSTSVAYLRSLAAEQAQVAHRIVGAIPSAQVSWHYGVVLDGIAVTVPNDRLAALARVPGVAKVWPSVTYRPLLDRSPEQIGADQLWGGPTMPTAGNGIKIGIIDDGIDQSHPFFSPTTFTMPPGFPKGDTAFTTAKVIVARVFSPKSNHWKYAQLPFDPVESDHATHVAGIAAGEFTANAVAGRGPVSGVAPMAYLGNYKALTVPTPEFGLNGNSPELAAAIEAAVKDGMDVINLSLGEPEIEISRDIVVAAIDGAADAGVVPAVAAGNEGDTLGRGSVGSPGNAPQAISAAAVSKSDVLAYFSSIGPTPMSLQLKPDVSAPGVSILSSVPAHEGSWAQFSGTSMASPHVAGGAALLKQRHPTWTVAQLKSALVLTADPVFSDTQHGKEASTLEEGGGLIDLPRANDPLIFAAPTNFTFGLLRAGTSATRSVALNDAGGGLGDWSVTVVPQSQTPGVTVSASVATITVPGRLDLTATSTSTAAQADLTGFVVLANGSNTRRIPYWLRVESPQLGPASASLTRTGDYKGDTRGKPSRVTSYRYPDDPGGLGIKNSLPGPEQVFEVRLTKPVTNFGVAVTRVGPGVHVSPRVVAGGDENRLTGNTGLPVDQNDYLPSYGNLEPIAGALFPAAGTYDVVFDTPSDAEAGPFAFRFWTNDTTPPAVRMLTRSAKAPRKVAFAVGDSGSGVDPSSLSASIDGHAAEVSYAHGKAVVFLPRSLAHGRHRILLVVSDYQEEKNNENSGPSTPNTNFFRATLTIR